MSEALEQWKGKPEEQQLLLMNAQLHVSKGDVDGALAILNTVCCPAIGLVLHFWWTPFLGTTWPAELQRGTDQNGRNLSGGETRQVDVHRLL